MAKAGAQFVLGVDLDGVCADFYGGLRLIAAEWLAVDERDLNPEVTYGLPQWGIKKTGARAYDKLHRFAVTQRNLFGDLKPIPGAAAVLRRLSAKNIRIRIITHRLFIKHFHQTAVQQTVAWLDRYDFPYWDLCLLADKAAVGANTYVEDSPSNVARLRKDGHDTIVFTNSTNRQLPGPRADTWEEVEGLVLERLRKWHVGKKQLAGV